jgi:hypothetical protein
VGKEGKRKRKTDEEFRDKRKYPVLLGLPEIGVTK